MRCPVMILGAVLFLFGGGARADAPVRPVLVGIYAQNYDETVSWYKSNLGFETVREVVNEGVNLRIGFLDNGAFELEIYCDIVPGPTAKRLTRDRFGMPGEGFVKLAVETRDIRRLAATLSANDAEFVQEIKESDRKPGQSWFIVQDPDGNLIQVFGPTTTVGGPD